MIKKIGKKVLLAVSVIVSGAMGFLLQGPDQNADQNPIQGMQKPILAINTAHGDAGGGDCSGCGGTCDTGWNPPYPDVSSGVTIRFEKF